MHLIERDDSVLVIIDARHATATGCGRSKPLSPSRTRTPELSESPGFWSQTAR